MVYRLSTEIYIHTMQTPTFYKLKKVTMFHFYKPQTPYEQTYATTTLLILGQPYTPHQNILLS